MRSILDWIYIYIGQNETCSVYGNVNGDLGDIPRHSLNVTRDFNKNEGFGGLEAFGIAISVLIVTVVIVVGLFVLWKQKLRQQQCVALAT